MADGQCKVDSYGNVRDPNNPNFIVGDLRKPSDLSRIIAKCGDDFANAGGKHTSPKSQSDAAEVRMQVVGNLQRGSLLEGPQ